jgi:GT2 family glycosyltransferase
MTGAAHPVLLRTLKWIAWGVALAWLGKLAETARGLPKVPDLHDANFDCEPGKPESLTVIVPARNEEADVVGCVRSLLAQSYERVSVIAIDDRSTDATGELLDRLAMETSHESFVTERRLATKTFDSVLTAERLMVLHVEELPPGWLGKTHAMAVAARHTTSDWLLFTDADIYYEPTALRRAMALAQQTAADHLVVVPTMEAHRWDEGMVLGFFQVLGLWAARLWRVDDPRAKRDAIGVGAFNMIRREAYLQIGGFEALRFEILEDVGLGRRVKRAGLRQRIAFGHGLVRVHWAKGALGLVEGMTKNMFAAFRFRPELALGACVWMTGFCLLPPFGLLVSGFRLPAMLTIVGIVGMFALCRRWSGLPWWYVVLFPGGAALMIYTLLQSMVRTLREGGVRWRGTFYPLAELREKAAPLPLPWE